MGGITFVRGITAQPQEHEIGFTCNGNGAAITTGEKVSIAVPYDAVIQAITIFSDVSGSVVVDVWKSASPTFPSVANSICASAKPTLSSQQYVEDETLTGWTKTINKDDILTFNIDSADGVIGRVTLILRTQ